MCSVDNVRNTNPVTRTLTVTGESDTVVHKYSIGTYMYMYKAWNLGEPA